MQDVRLSFNVGQNRLRQTMQDRTMVFLEVELECGVGVSICTIFDSLRPPNAQIYALEDRRRKNLMLALDAARRIVQK